MFTLNISTPPRNIRSTPTYRRKIDSRQPPPPALTRQYTPGVLPIDKRPPGAAGHRDTSKLTRDTAAGLDKEEAPSPAIKKKARTRSVCSSKKRR